MLPGQADYIAQLQALDPIISIDSGRSCSLELRRATEAPSSMAVLKLHPDCSKTASPYLTRHRNFMLQLPIYIVSRSVVRGLNPSICRGWSVVRGALRRAGHTRAAAFET